MKHLTTPALVLATALALSACGETRMEHMGSGALMGGALGVGVAAVTAPTLLTGGLIGAGVGAVAGAVAPECPMSNWGW
ncbi:MAG: hypothetical protein WAZ18_03135 [Alphaproteobacteria bacterium]